VKKISNDIQLKSATQGTMPWNTEAGTKIIIKKFHDEKKITDPT
jgi:hypothetical protein